MLKIKYFPMYVYRLKRKKENIDKQGRPAILLKYLGSECLVWTGTTQLLETTKELPATFNISNKKTHFYAKGIQKVNTIDLISFWNNKNNSICELKIKQQEELIQKMSSFTKAKNPYLIIKDLEVKTHLQEAVIKQLKTQIKELTKKDKRRK